MIGSVFASTGFVMNKAIYLISMIASSGASDGDLLTYLALTNIPLIPGYALIFIGTGKLRYVLYDAALNNIVVPSITSNLLK